jgi:hypothetical protein
MMQIVMVEWDDAVLRDTHNDTDIIVHEPLRLHSVGFLLKTDEKGVTICTDYDPIEGTYREQSFIPRGMIVNQTTFGG